MSTVCGVLVPCCWKVYRRCGGTMLMFSFFSGFLLGLKGMPTFRRNSLIRFSPVSACFLLGQKGMPTFRRNSLIRFSPVSAGFLPGLKCMPTFRKKPDQVFACFCRFPPCLERYADVSKEQPDQVFACFCRFPAWLILRPWKWRRFVSPQRWACVELCSVRGQKPVPLNWVLVYY
jgi:hypothetical protein